MHVPEQDVLALLRLSEVLVGKAEAGLDALVSSLKALHKAEQVRLLVRLAADSGARRGELAALKFNDLNGRVLTIERGVSGEQIGPTKTKRTRRLTLGRTTVELWRASEETWSRRVEGDPFGEWVFSRDIDHQRRLTAGALGHWFAELCAEADLGRSQSPPAAALCGHVPGRARGDPPGPTPARSSRSVHDAAELRPRPSVGRR